MTPRAPRARKADPDPKIRPLRRSDRWGFQALRLEALATDPLAFGSTFVQESKDSESRWEERVRGAVGSTTEAVWVAESTDGSLIGMVGMFVEKGRDHAHLWGMWVHPEHRRRGVGAALVDALLEHADTVWLTPELKLSVNPTQKAAVNLYRSRGFVPTGRTEPLGHTEGAIAAEWRRRRARLAP
ncbi:MAG: GNAT family N-acetyltransferase [Thermoplasmata archaeon]|nr:GNAT family N-acetyltransferase [Thermoplasmata archaeon]